MKRHLYLIFLGMSAMIMASAPAHAAPACADHAAIVDRLEKIYGEGRHAVGLGADNTLVEVYASAETGSWTITVTQAGGPTCLVAAGQSFQLETPDTIIAGNDA